LKGAQQIDVDDRLESVGAQARGGCRKVACRPRHQHIDLASALHERRERVGDGLRLAHVEAETERGGFRPG
jgi:hypothetical protein